MMAPHQLSRWVAARFGLPAPVVSLIRAYTNDVYLVESGAGRFVLKVYGAGWRTDDEIRWEIDLLHHLRERNAPVTAPIPGIDGDPLQVMSVQGTRRQAVLFEHATGHKPQPPFSTAMYRRQGEMTATVHLAADGFVPRHERTPLDLACLIDQPLAAIESLEPAPAVVRAIEEIGARIRTEMAPPIVAGLDQGPCHGDLTFDNVHITDDGSTTLYDFDSSGPGWRAVDLQGWAAMTPGRDRDWRAFLDGYRHVRPLSDADVAAAPLLALAVEIRGLQIELDRRLQGRSQQDIELWLTGAAKALRSKARAMGPGD